MIRVFIGYDYVEAAAYHVHSHSIMTRSSMPVSITPVSLKNLKGILTRGRHHLQSNDFSFSRFLVPWMCNFEGWAIFTDCDMIVRDDIAKLWALRDDKFAVMCVHHDHRPIESKKYLGNVQTQYDRKNWSSVMLMNCAKCKALTPDYVNIASGLDLHQFKWLEDDQIGYIPNQWNHLVGYDPMKDAALVHFTTGGPWLKEYKRVDFNEEWKDEKQDMLHIYEDSQ